jgi:hypothetical protein
MEDRFTKRAEELQEELHETMEELLKQSGSIKINYQDVSVVFILHKIASLQCVMEDILNELKKYA